MDILYKQNTNKKTASLNDAALDQINLIDRHSTFHPKAAAYTFFSSVHG